jgi:geranylgeranyl pyrophosphate synthase
MVILENQIFKNAKNSDFFLQRYLNKKKEKSKIFDAINYGLFSGGKKFRSFLICNTGEIFRINKKILVAVGAAVECVHSYSLMHDDLSCMDDDNFRRGKPSTHKVFGESTTILAGNSLLTLAFEILTSNQLKCSSSIKSELVYALSSCSGYKGVAGGQYLDLKFEKMKTDKNKILEMQNKKTGALISFCLESAAILANKPNDRIFLKKIGFDIGLLFQITDDLLDIFGNSKKTGKLTRKDNKKGKATLFNKIGFNKTIEFAYFLFDRIKERLEKKYGTRAYSLISSVEFLLKRER